MSNFQVKNCCIKTISRYNTPGHTQKAPTVTTKAPTRELNIQQGPTTIESGTLHQTTIPTTNKNSCLCKSNSSSHNQNYSYTNTYLKNYPNPPSSYLPILKATKSPISKQN